MSRTPPGAALAGARSRSALRSALRGAGAFAGVAGLGLLIGMGEYAASGGAYRLWTWVKVGSLYLVSFFGVGVRVDVGGRELFLLRLPLMAGTVLAGWLLFRAGRRATGLRAWSAGWVVAGFVLPVWALALPARLRFPDLGGAGVDATVHAIAWQALLFPAVFAAIVVAAGVVSGRAAGSSRAAAVRRIMAGGWRMTWLALMFAFAGLLAVAAIHPGRAAEYGRWLGSQGRGGTLLVGHELLAAPNAAFFALAPAMGGATTVSGTAGARSVAASVRVSGVGPVAFLPPGNYPARDFGGIFYLLMLVPLAATVTGGRFAATGASHSGARVVRGAGAGLVFGMLITAGSVFAAVASPLSRAQLPIHVGVAMPATALLAMAWGIGGGVLGALFAPQPAGVAPGEGAEPPLSPTSA